MYWKSYKLDIWATFWKWARVKTAPLKFEAKDPVYKITQNKWFLELAGLWLAAAKSFVQKWAISTIVTVGVRTTAAALAGLNLPKLNFDTYKKSKLNEFMLNSPLKQNLNFWTIFINSDHSGVYELLQQRLQAWIRHNSNTVCRIFQHSRESFRFQLKNDY